MSSHPVQSREADDERLNFEEIDALNNDFDRDSASTSSDHPTANRVHMTTAERMDKLINDIGGLGRFQLFAYFVITYGISGQGFFFYTLGYLIQQPVYECSYNGEEPSENICTAANICNSDPRIASWVVDSDHELSLSNWQSKLDLMCVNPWKVGFIGSAFFLGWCTTILWLPRLSDKYGRKKFFVVGMAIQLLLYTLLMVCESLDVMIALMFAFGMNCSIRINVGYIYLMELMPKNKQTLVGTIWNIGEAMIYFMATIYFWKISKDWYYIVLIGYFMTVFGFFGSLLLPESPRLLVELKRIDEAKSSLDTIARWNKKHLGFYLNDFLQTSPKSTSQRNDQPDNHELQIGGLPNDIDEKNVRKFLNENIGDNNEKILSVILSNEPGYVSNCDLAKCFVGFDDETSMLESIESLKGIGYQGYQLSVHKRKSLVRKPSITTPGMRQRDGENSAPIFLTNTPKNFEAALAKQEEDKNSLSYYLGQRRIQINLLIMCFIWLSTSFNFYLIQFLINTFQQVYPSAIGSSISEILAYAFAGVLYQFSGIKSSLFLSFGIAFLGGFAILAYGLAHPQDMIFPILVLVSKFGIACAFNIIYVSHSSVFPIAFAATAMGFCNFFARIFSATSPVLAQIEEPLPMIAFTFTSVTACILALGIQTGSTPQQPSATQKWSTSQKKEIVKESIRRYGWIENSPQRRQQPGQQKVKKQKGRHED